MSHWDDALGDAVKAIEDGESLRRAEPGTPVVVRIDGASFSRFTSVLGKPFDEALSRAMVEATRSVVQDFNCRLGYTQSDEASFLFWDPDAELPFGGRFQKMASRVASKFGAAFLLRAMKDFPEAVERQTPEFDGRATAFPSLELAAGCILWREIDARRNAVGMAAHAMFSHRDLQGKSVRQKRDMLAGAGFDFEAVPEAFRRGTFLRRACAERYLTPEELERIPPAHRPTGPVTRSRVCEVEMPPLSRVTNLVDVLFHAAEPELRASDGFFHAVQP